LIDDPPITTTTKKIFSGIDEAVVSGHLIHHPTRFHLQRQNDGLPFPRRWH
jgi:hypothetical protein